MLAHCNVWYSVHSWSLMALVIVFKSSFLFFGMFTDVKENVSIVIVSLVSLAFSSATHMAIISASSTYEESLSQTATVPPFPSLEPSVQYVLSSG